MGPLAVLAVTAMIFTPPEAALDQRKNRPSPSSERSAGLGDNPATVGVAIGRPSSAAVSLRHAPQVPDFRQAGDQQQVDHHTRRQRAQPGLGDLRRGQGLEGQVLGELTDVARGIPAPSHDAGASDDRLGAHGVLAHG